MGAGSRPERGGASGGRVLNCGSVCGDVIGGDQTAWAGPAGEGAESSA